MTQEKSCTRRVVGCHGQPAERHTTRTHGYPNPLRRARIKTVVVYDCVSDYVEHPGEYGKIGRVPSTSTKHYLVVGSRMARRPCIPWRTRVG
jgi:hypothetical protein